MSESPSDPPRIRILFAVHQVVMGGVEKVLCEYLKELQKDATVECCVYSRRPVTEPYFLDFFARYGIPYINGVQKKEFKKTHFFLLKWLRKPFKCYYTYAYFSAVKKIFEGYDIIVDFTNFLFSEELLRMHIPVIGYYHGSILHFIRHADKRVLSAYKKVVCLTHSFKQDFEAKYPQYRGVVENIYNPIDASAVREAAMQQAPPLNKPYFVAVQRLDPHEKDVETLIRAFAAFQQEHPEYWLYIVGDGEQMTYLKSLAPHEHIVFTGQMDNPYPLIRQAQALILSSLKEVGEGLPNVLLEAQILRVLAVSSEVKSGPAEILLNGEAGVLYEAGSPDSLCCALRDIADHPEAYRNKLDAAEQALPRFAAQESVRRLLALVRS